METKRAEAGARKSTYRPTNGAVSGKPKSQPTVRNRAVSSAQYRTSSRPNASKSRVRGVHEQNSGSTKGQSRRSFEDGERRGCAGWWTG